MVLVQETDDLVTVLLRLVLQLTKPSCHTDVRIWEAVEKLCQLLVERLYRRSLNHIEPRSLGRTAITDRISISKLHQSSTSSRSQNASPLNGVQVDNFILMHLSSYLPKSLQRHGLSHLAIPQDNRLPALKLQSPWP